jgi:hypothetical protein
MNGLSHIIYKISTCGGIENKIQMRRAMTDHQQHLFAFYFWISFAVGNSSLDPLPKTLGKVFIFLNTPQLIQQFLKLILT